MLSALGPLVVYRVVQDQYRAQPGLPPLPAVFLQQRDEPGLPSPLLRALLAGELVASLSLLAAEGKMTAAECAAQALAAGVPAPLFVMLWARLHPPAE